MKIDNVMYAHFYCRGAPVAIVVRPPSASRLPLPAPSAYPVRLPLPLGLCVCVLLRSAVAVVLSVQRLLHACLLFWELPGQVNRMEGWSSPTISYLPALHTGTESGHC